MRKLLTLTAIVLASTVTGSTVAQAHSRYWSYGEIARGLYCIFKYEHAGYGWTVNTGNGYYGGLQMDMGFQRAYGSKYLRRWGTADNWPVWAQIDAGVRGARARGGFNPWPNTRKPCGLPYYF